ncbi:MAG: HAMP domain-containing sensor histidine kinase [Pseudomonadota bacterium]
MSDIESILRDTDKELPPEKHAGIFKGLSARLLLLTVLFIMLAEILIFVPSIANFRNVWLRNHLDIADAASIVYLDSNELMLSENARASLLETTKSLNVAVRRDGMSRLIASEKTTLEISEHIDLDASGPLSSIQSALSMMVADPKNQYRVFGEMRSTGSVIELVQTMEPIQNALWRYARNILILSLLVSVFAAILVYLALYRMIVLPIIRLSTNMDQFSKQPENASLVHIPSSRTDEIGLAENRLSSLQQDLQGTLRQKRRLADLGLAVAKINHDLRNILASAQLFSDRLSTLPDPTVQRFAPKLIRTIDRAVDYTKSVIDYGKALEAPPNRRKLYLKNLVDDVAESLGLQANSEIKWENSVDANLQADADPEQLFRVLMNLCRNAQQAMMDMPEGSSDRRLNVTAERFGPELVIRIKDTGPGIPDAIREKIFEAFQGSTKVGGSGLGITIAAELVRSHGGTIVIENTGTEGTCFKLDIPDVTATKLEAEKLTGK